MAGLLGVMLALLFATLLMLADAKARINAESHYATPAEPPMNRTSLIPAVQVVSDGGW